MIQAQADQVETHERLAVCRHRPRAFSLLDPQLAHIKSPASDIPCTSCSGLRCTKRLLATKLPETLKSWASSPLRSFDRYQIDNRGS
jgi:hypothetical protein